MRSPSGAAFPFVDRDLARRLERAEASANAASVDARARLAPTIGAAWIEVAGAYAMFDGVGSPLTQTFGLGLFEPVGAAEMDRIEAFFGERGSATCQEVSPLADPALLPLLTGRGYAPIEFTSVMFRPIGAMPASAATAGAVVARAMREAERDAWTKTAVEGWGDLAGDETVMRDLARLSTSRRGATCFLAEAEGRLIGTGVLDVRDGVGLLSGASTVPSARGRGAQLGLLDARLRFAADRGCDVVMMCALPGSTSQRNAERQGFRVAYTRVKWQLPRRSAVAG